MLKTFNFINICIIRKQIVKNRQAYIQNVPTSWPNKHQLKDPSKIDGTGLVSQEIILQMIRLAEGIYIKKVTLQGLFKRSGHLLSLVASRNKLIKTERVKWIIRLGLWQCPVSRF